MNTTVVLSDVHFPYHDEKVLNSVTDFVIDLKPDELVLNGDIVDMYEISSFDKNPKVRVSIQQELAMAKEWMSKLALALPKAKKTFIFGNHEFRWDRYFMRQAPELIGLPGMTLSEQLELSDFGFSVIDSGLRENYYDNGSGVLIGHWDKVSKHSAYTAKNLLDEVGQSLVQGHVHRIGQHFRTTKAGMKQAVEGGCLCDVNPSYVLDPNWQRGFTVIHNENNTNLIQSIAVNNGYFAYGDRIYNAKGQQ